MHSFTLEHQSHCLISPTPPSLTEHPESLAESSLTRGEQRASLGGKAVLSQGLLHKRVPAEAQGGTYPDLGPLAGAEGAVRALEGTGPGVGPFVTLHLRSAREGLCTDLAGKLL